MPTLAEASLSDVERRGLDRIVAVLEQAFGERLRSVWLYGSKARGEPPTEGSDVDLLLVVDAADWEDDRRAFRLVLRAAEEEGADPIVFSPRVYSPERLA